ncbi:hypothetical protein T484DRAFT_1970537 [Baffinella frigidus]|nr:hypothetical protein T484DRAFT_1970537 [Cryptophyta sp. CCMP2293]
MPRSNRLSSLDNAIDHRRPSILHTSEKEAMFPSPAPTRRLLRLRRHATTSALPYKTAGKGIGRSASNAETRFRRRLSDPGELFGPTRSSTKPTLRFPVQFYAIGQCLAHPDCICKCIKTREMAHSQKYNWHELGNRFKLVERTVSETLERSLSSPGTTLSYAATPQVERIRRSKSETLKLRLQYLNNARAAGPPRAGASGSPGHLPAVARRRSSQHRRTPELVL